MLQIVLDHVGRSDAEAVTFVATLRRTHGNGITVGHHPIGLLEVQFLTILAKECELFHLFRHNINSCYIIIFPAIRPVLFHFC